MIAVLVLEYLNMSDCRNHTLISKKFNNCLRSNFIKKQNLWKLSFGLYLEGWSVGSHLKL